MSILTVETSDGKTTVTLGDVGATFPENAPVGLVASVLEHLTNKYTKTRDHSLSKTEMIGSLMEDLKASQ